MVASIPIDVIRDTRNMAQDMKDRSANLRAEADKKMTQADLLYSQAMRIESMCDSWLKSFPEAPIF